MGQPVTPSKRGVAHQPRVTNAPQTHLPLQRPAPRWPQASERAPQRGGETRGGPSGLPAAQTRSGRPAQAQAFEAENTICFGGETVTRQWIDSSGWWELF